ncbi:MAG TPA: hypothetical protein PLJ87_03515 [Anaerolineaceae bacterium]|jgi:hypothetical protein|nr:hypothetical protein [Anaerolineaceae bacterium]HOR83991.1 hypothetical protein [Anaerolineaceae bacterium]HPY33185.1 hypothetical protein [Anaerolineaceae bacterium]
MPLITLFSAPKPFTNPHIALIQRNALASWQALGSDAAVALVGDEPGIAEAAAEFGFTHLPQVAVNALGTPLISSIFALGRSLNESPYLAYVNADILLFPDFVDCTRRVGAVLERFLLVGRRWDLDVEDLLRFDPEGQAALLQKLQAEGRLHARTGSDYFIFPRACFQDIPDFTVGRAGWDNWMIYQARAQGWPAVDASADLRIIHQNHDYSHLPNGQQHYRLPETGENVHLAGGWRTIFVLDDASHQLLDGKIAAFPSGWNKFWREVQHFPLLKWHNYALTQILFTLFHPKRAWGEFWKNRAFQKARKEA